MAAYDQVTAALTVLRGPGAGTRFSIEAPTVTIGRHGQCDVQVNNVWLSRQHARITWTGIGYTVEDLGSTNGTYVNGERVSGPRALRSGDSLQLGEEVELVFQMAAPAPFERPAPVGVAPPSELELEPVPPSTPAPDDLAKQEAAKAASSALLSAIVGLLICGIILEPVAISQARKARKTLRPGDPGYRKAQVAEIIGWIGLGLWFLALIYQLSNM